jgi:hypothetical protein
LSSAYRRVHDEGFEPAREISSDKARVVWLEVSVLERERKLDDAERYYEFNGAQVVEVDGYAYRWQGDTPPAVGDKALLPQNWLSEFKNGPVYS